MARLLEAVRAVGSDLELPVVLRHIVEAAVTLVQAEYGALGVVDADGEGLSEFITVGVDEATGARIGAPPSGLGVLGELLRAPEPLRLRDLAQHPRSVGFPADHPPMGTFLGVPVRVGDTVFGNLYLTNKLDGGEFTDDDEEVLVALAVAAGVAVRNARLYEQARRGAHGARPAGRSRHPCCRGPSARTSSPCSSRRPSACSRPTASSWHWSRATGCTWRRPPAPLRRRRTAR